MNTSDQPVNPATLPQRIPPIPPGGFLPLPLGEDPADREPVLNPITAVEAILRQPRRVMYQLRQPGAGRLIASMLFVTVLCSLVYGVIVGSFSGGTQWWAAPVKIAGGLLTCALICLPSLYIFGCLSGAQVRVREMFGMVLGLLMLLTILLIGFAPVAWLFSQSTEQIVWMGVLHLLFFAVATGFGLRFLDAAFSHAHARSPVGLRTWVIIFLLVMLQMSTALRPLLGKADDFLPAKKRFFISHWGECIKDAQRGAGYQSRE
jgi:hypothetical protein